MADSKSKSTTAPDWAHHLPTDMIQLISQKINSITDYINYRAVCKPWRSASLSKPLHLPPHLPWLMIPYYHNLKDAKKKGSKPNMDNGDRLFYDFWQSKMHKLHLPEIIGFSCCASYRGWLVLVATVGSEVFLFNPLTHARVQLPAFSIPVKILGEKDDSRYEAQTWFAPITGNFVIRKLLFSTDPTDPKCLIMVFLQSTLRIFFYRAGDTCWTMINRYSAGAAYHDGHLYLLSHEGMVRVYDLNYPGKMVESFRLELQYVEKYILEGKSGVYMVIVRQAVEEEEEEEQVGDGQKLAAQEDQDDPSHDADGNDKCPRRKIELFQVVGQRLEQVVDTSDTTIFYGDNSQCFAICSDDWDALDGDCMYIELFGAPPAANNENESCNSIYFSKLDPIKLKLLVSNLGLGERPRLWRAAPAMWFQPSFV